MSTAFKATIRSAEEHLDVSPSLLHTLPYVTGGYRTLLDRIKTRTVPNQPAPGFFTSKDGHFELKGACLIGSRYDVIKVLDPKGQSAVLVLAEDLFDGTKLVVIKVLHSQYFQIGIQESHMLTRLAALDPLNISQTLRLLTTVQFDSHYCLVLEPLLPDPLTAVFAELPSHKVLNNIKKVGLRLLASIGFLHHHNMIHTDLKPENLLLKDDRDLESVHIVDFGNTLHYVHSEVSLYYKDFELQTPLYRAPEVMFGMPFGVEIDLWSLGCILAELYLTDALFLGTSVTDIMSKIVDILGPFPSQLFRRGKYYKKYQRFTGDVEPVNGTLQLMEHLQCKDVLFADLLAGLLKYNPGERLTASEAACHPFFASHCPIAFLLPTATGSKGTVKVASGGVCPESYPFTPAIAADVKKRQPTPIELLRLGTAELSQLNETYILKPSPKAGTIRRHAFMEGNNSYGQDDFVTDDSKYNEKGLSLTGHGDMSVIRNAVQSKEKGKFSTNVKEKMSELLKAIRAEQDLVESDLDRKDQALKYDRIYKRGESDREEIFNGKFPEVVNIGQKQEKLKRESGILQPSPKYGNYIEGMNKNTCMYKDTKIKMQDQETSIENTGGYSSQTCLKSYRKREATEHVNIGETLPKCKMARQNNTDFKEFSSSPLVGRKSRQNADDRISNCRVINLKDDAGSVKVRQRTPHNSKNENLRQTCATDLYKKSFSSNEFRTEGKRVVKVSNEIDIDFRHRKTKSGITSGRQIQYPAGRKKSQENLELLDETLADESLEEDLNLVHPNMEKQFGDTVDRLHCQKKDEYFSSRSSGLRQSLDLTEQDLSSDSSFTVGKRSSSRQSSRRNSNPLNNYQSSCIETNSSISSDMLDYSHDRSLSEETTNYLYDQRVQGRNIEVSKEKRKVGESRETYWTGDSLTLSNSKRNPISVFCTGTTDKYSDIQSEDEYVDLLSPGTETALHRKSRDHRVMYSSQTSYKHRKYAMDRMQKKKGQSKLGTNGEFECRNEELFGAPNMRGSPKENGIEHMENDITNLKKTTKRQRPSFSDDPRECSTTQHDIQSDCKRQRDNDNVLDINRKDNVKRKLITCTNERNKTDLSLELSKKRRKSQLIHTQNCHEGMDTDGLHLSSRKTKHVSLKHDKLVNKDELLVQEEKFVTVNRNRKINQKPLRYSLSPTRDMKQNQEKAYSSRKGTRRSNETFSILPKQ